MYAEFCGMLFNFFAGLDCLYGLDSVYTQRFCLSFFPVIILVRYVFVAFVNDCNYV